MKCPRNRGTKSPDFGVKHSRPPAGRSPNLQFGEGTYIGSTKAIGFGQINKKINIQ